MLTKEAIPTIHLDKPESSQSQREQRSVIRDALRPEIGYTY